LFSRPLACICIYVRIQNGVKDCTKISGMFLENRSDSVHKYGHAVRRVLSTLCTLNRSHTMPMQAFEVVANESNELKSTI